MESMYVFLYLPLVLVCLNLLSSLFFSRKKLPPGPKGFPILGNLLTIGDRPHESLSNLAKIHGPLMTVKFGLNDVVVASSTEMAKEILQTNDYAFSGRPVPDAIAAEEDHDLSMAWISGQGSHWKMVRKVCNSHIFTTQRLDMLQGLRHQMVEGMLDHIAKSRENGEAIDIGRLVFGTTLNLLSNTMMSGDLYDVKSKETKVLKDLIANLMELAGRPNIVDSLPFLKPFDPQGVRKRMKVWYDEFHVVLYDIIERRVKRRASDSTRSGDFLDVLLDYTEDNGSEEFNHQHVMMLLMDMFIGGTHNSTTTLEWAMAELLRNPDVLAALKKELSKNITSPRMVQEQDIPNLPYLGAVIKESLRLHPTAPLLLPHRAEQEVNINGYIIPKHTRVFVNVWSISRDPLYWPDPTSFKPERFLKHDFDYQGRDFCFLPFGSGRRMCPGLNLGLRMVSLMLANLVNGFDWKLPEEIDMKDRFGITLEKHHPLMAIPL